MKPWQVVTLGIILLAGYALFAVGGYLIGVNATEQQWQARVAYIAYAEERVCHLRSRVARDVLAIIAEPTDDACAMSQESEGMLDTQAATWKSVTPPKEWQGWHVDILTATEVACQSYEHLLAACDYYADWEFSNATAEINLAVGMMEPAIESLKPEHRPWAISP